MGAGAERDQILSIGAQGPDWVTRVRNSTDYAAATGEAWTAWEAYR